MNAVVAAGPVIPNFGQGSKCEQTNGWWCTDWLHAHWGDTLQPALFQHIELSLIAVSIGFALAFLLALVGVRYRLLDAPIGGERRPGLPLSRTGRELPEHGASDPRALPAAGLRA